MIYDLKNHKKHSSADTETSLFMISDLGLLIYRRG